jgi:Holliday junction DNA helicase RuvA
MIGMLTGRPVEVSESALVLDVNGVGYEVAIPARLATKLAVQTETVSLQIHTHVREDAIVLFGFESTLERALFRQLTSVKGIGPKIGLAMMSESEPAALVRAIEANDIAYLSSIPGIGKRTAERLALELREKISGFAGVQDAHATDAPEPHATASDAVSALVNMGYRRIEAQDAVRLYCDNHPEIQDISTMLRGVLQQLAR